MERESDLTTTSPDVLLAVIAQLQGPIETRTERPSPVARENAWPQAQGRRGAT